jgi:hypothetical protein
MVTIAPEATPSSAIRWEMKKHDNQQQGTGDMPQGASGAFSMLSELVQFAHLPYKLVLNREPWSVKFKSLKFMGDLDVRHLRKDRILFY